MCAKCLGCGKEVDPIAGDTTYLCSVCGTYSQIGSKDKNDIKISATYLNKGDKIVVICTCNACNTTKKQEFSLAKIMFNH